MSEFRALCKVSMGWTDAEYDERLENCEGNELELLDFCRAWVYGAKIGIFTGRYYDSDEELFN